MNKTEIRKEIHAYWERVDDSKGLVKILDAIIDALPEEATSREEEAAFWVDVLWNRKQKEGPEAVDAKTTQPTSALDPDYEYATLHTLASPTTRWIRIDGSKESVVEYDQPLAHLLEGIRIRRRKAGPPIANFPGGWEPVPDADLGQRSDPPATSPAPVEVKESQPTSACIPPEEARGYMDTALSQADRCEAQNERMIELLRKIYERIPALGQRSDPPATSAAQPPEATADDYLCALDDARKLRIMKAMEDIATKDFYLCSEADEVISGLRTSLVKSVKDVLSFMHQLDEKDAVIAELRGEIERLAELVLLRGRESSKELATKGETIAKLRELVAFGYSEASNHSHPNFPFSAARKRLDSILGLSAEPPATADHTK